MDVSELDLEVLARLMRGWIRERRDYYRPGSAALAPAERARLDGYFAGATLGRVRVCDVDHEAMQNEFDALESAGVPLPADVRGFAGLTLVDTIVVCAPRLGPHNPRASVLFQECVHVCQYALVELDAFVGDYLADLVANGFDTAGVTVEREAQRLRERFDASPERFPVEEIVRRRVQGAQPCPT